jgi:multiple sugar transport system substrate-binding protein
MTSSGVSRRRYLTSLGVVAAGSLLSACGVGGAPSPADGRTKAAVTPLRIWFHWGGVRGESIQKMMDEYNATQGQEDKNTVTVETVRDAEMLTKMTASVVGGDPPDVWHANATPKVAADRGLIVTVPRDEEQYIKRNYVPGATERMTLNGKIWGYPTEFQAPAFVYRKSHYRDSGLTKPPATTEEVFEHATKLTRRSGGTNERFGFTVNDGWYASVLPTLIARFGGQMYHFNGDKPTKIEVASPQAIEAVSWWKRLVDAGHTQLGQMPYTDTMQQGKAAATECFVWFVTGNTRDRGLNEIYDDLGAEVLPSKRGVKPIVFAGGWGLVGPSGAKQPDERWRLMRWMMHKPAMRFTRFIVDFVGSMPSATDYPTKIEGWTADLSRAFAVESPKIAQSHPTTKVLGTSDLNPAVTESITAILSNEVTLQTGLQQLNTKLNEILQRNNP